MELSIGKELVCPAGVPDMPDKHYDMEPVYRLEARQQEIATVSKVTAPELMQAFIDGYGHTSRALVQLEWELTQAKKFAEERKAIVFLEVAPTELAKRGLTRPGSPAGTETLREAVLAIDKPYQALQDRASMIEAAVEFLKAKMKGFEMSYQAVKKVYDSLSSTNALTNNFNGFSARPYADELIIDTTQPTRQSQTVGVDVNDRQMAIGKPRY